MTPEELTEICEEILDSAKRGYPLRIGDDEAVAMAEACVRLSSIEAAGDEEVESLHESFYKLLPLNTLEARRCGAFDDACDIAKSRLIRLKAAEERVRELEALAAKQQEMLAWTKRD